MIHQSLFLLDSGARSLLNIGERKIICNFFPISTLGDETEPLQSEDHSFFRVTLFTPKSGQDDQFLINLSLFSIIRISKLMEGMISNYWGIYPFRIGTLLLNKSNESNKMSIYLALGKQH